MDVDIMAGIAASEERIPSEVTKVFWKTDEHVPFHDMQAIELAMKICSDFDPDILPAGSDGMDHYSISKYDKDPGRLKAGGLQDEIDIWKSIERGWNQAAPNAERLMILGNHEERLTKYIWKHPELHGLDALSVKNLYGLDGLGIKQAPNNEIVVFNTLFHHGERVSKYSAYTAKAELEDLAYGMDSITGHTHRGGIHFRTTVHGIRQSIEGFCLCDLEPPYMTRPNWQQGVVLAEITAHSAHYEPVPFIRDGSRLVARWRGKEYRN